MNISGYRPIRIDRIRGAQPMRAKGLQTNSRALSATNVVTSGVAMTVRDGYVLDHTRSAQVRDIYHWIAEVQVSPNRLVIREADQRLFIRYRESGTNQLQHTYPNNTTNVTIQELDSRLYITSRNKNLANGGVTIVDPVDLVTDRAFAPPIAGTLVGADVEAGEVSPGKHLFGFVGTSRSGFTGKLSPVVSNVFTPYEYDVVSSNPTVGRKISITVTIPAQSEISFIELIMTTVDNHARFFVLPDSRIALPPNATYTYTYTVDTADDVITAAWEDVTDFNSWITRDQGSNVDPISCHVAIPYANRMVYLSTDKVLISEPFAPQRISFDQHALSIKNSLHPTAAFVVRTVLYIGTFTNISGIGEIRTAPPVNWGTLDQVAAMGIPAQNCVATVVGSDSGTSYAVIANRAGLWYFDGNLSQKPISVQQEDIWFRINWNRVENIRIVDDTTARQIKVLAPLDDEVFPTRLLIWDYADAKNVFGMQYDTVDFYMYTLNDQEIHTIAGFQDVNTGMTDILALGPKQNGDCDIMFSRTLVRNDASAPYFGSWVCNGVLPASNGPALVHAFRCLQVWVHGYGVLRVVCTPTGIDDVASTPVVHEFEVAGSASVMETVPINRLGANLSVEFVLPVDRPEYSVTVQSFTVWVQQRGYGAQRPSRAL